MTDQITIKGLEELTPKQRKWVELVASGNYSDAAAYQKAYGCSRARAISNAWRNRAHSGIKKVLAQIQAHANHAFLETISTSTKKGRLAKIMLEGSDGDAIRAIKELNEMERQERERGGGEETEFSVLLMKIAKKRRLLPYEDFHDQRIIEAEELLR